MKENVVIGRMWNHKTDAYQVSTLQGIVHLKKNDKIHVRLNQGKIVSENHADYIEAPSLTVFRIGG